MLKWRTFAFKVKVFPYCENEYISDALIFTLKVNALYFLFVSHFSQLHFYHLVSCFHVFAGKLVSSMQPSNPSRYT